jgi:glyoxylase-like metal-dependent hydrolase (beta-lactamase superfamily II)
VIVERHPVGALQANAYLLADGGRAVVVDPGDEPARLLAAVERHGAVLDAVWLTHADFDHVGGVAGLLEVRRVPVYLHPDDAPLLASASHRAAAWGLTVAQPPTDTEPLADGMELRVGGVAARCLLTPGHSPGHVAFHLASEDLVLTGDALFRGAIGRTDRPFGDTATLLRSIRERLLVLPDATRALPGHGPETTIGLERRSNPFLIDR